MIILFSGYDKVKGFNIRIKEVINKELDRYNRMAVICASDDYSKNDIQNIDTISVIIKLQHG